MPLFADGIADKISAPLIRADGYVEKEREAEREKERERERWGRALLLRFGCALDAQLAQLGQRGAAHGQGQRLGRNGQPLGALLLLQQQGVQAGAAGAAVVGRRVAGQPRGRRGAPRRHAGQLRRRFGRRRRRRQVRRLRNRIVRHRHHPIRVSALFVWFFFSWRLAMAARLDPFSVSNDLLRTCSAVFREIYQAGDFDEN